MMALFSEEYIQKAYGQEKYDEGKNEGIAEGMAKGMAKGMTEGIAEGVNLMAKIAALLVKDGKFDAIVRASTDEEYRNDLIKEYRLA